MSLTRKFDEMMKKYGDDANADIIEQAKDIYRDELHATLGHQGTKDHPSHPGEAPHRVSGQLQASIVARVNPGALEAEVGTSAPYGQYLRPSRDYIGMAWNSARSRIERLFFDRK